MTRTGKGWRVRLKSRLVRLLEILIWLLSLMDRDERIYFPLGDIEHTSLRFLLMAYREAAERVVKFPNHENALEAIERIEAEMKRRDGLELAHTEAERPEPAEPATDAGAPLQKEPMPCSVRVADRIYTIEVDNELAAEERCDGYCQVVEKLIQIDTSHGGYQTASTLIHEILHAIYEEYNVNGNDDEERTVRSLERGLMQVFLDNPDLLQFIAQMTAGARLALSSDKPQK